MSFVHYLKKKGWLFDADVILKYAARKLNTDVSRKFFTPLLVQGTYKGHTIRVELTIWEGRSWSYRIIPKIIPRHQKRFMITHPKPTVETVFIGDAIYYDAWAPWDYADYSGKDYEEGIDKIFDELETAAKIVENDQPYFKGSLGPRKDPAQVQQEKVQAMNPDRSFVENPRFNKEANIIIFVSIIILCLIIYGFYTFFMKLG